MKSMIRVIASCKNVSRRYTKLTNSSWTLSGITCRRRHFYTLLDYSPERLNELDNLIEKHKTLLERYTVPRCDVPYLKDLIRNPETAKKFKCYMYDTHWYSTLHKPFVDINHILQNENEVRQNIDKRKEIKVNQNEDIISVIIELHKKMEMLNERIDLLRNKPEVGHGVNETSTNEKFDKKELLHVLRFLRVELERVFYFYAIKLPNESHENVPDTDTVLRHVNPKPEFDFDVFDHHTIGKKMNLIREDNIAHFSGRRTYYLWRGLADLEQALLRYSLDKLQHRGYKMISCPSILHGAAYEGTGMSTNKSILYAMDPAQNDSYFLSGTSEVPIAAYFANHAISHKQLPMKICCMSTCHRKETDSRKDARGIYRVHHFNKLEMFAITENHTGDESEEMFQEILDTQEGIFAGLGLHFRIVEMPSHELGLPAHRKVDMEAWMPGRGDYGEISSASNCTNFQSRRLHILTKRGGDYSFAHTLNGTACAVPRLIIALMEQYQTKDRTIELPDVLKPYLYGGNILKKVKSNKMEYIGPNQSPKLWKQPNK